jgi:hypothetical protein
VSKLVYRDTLTLEAGNIRVEGGQGDYISLECSGWTRIRGALRSHERA